MADKTHEALQLTEVLTYVTARHDVATVLREPLVAHANKLLKTVDGQVKDELEIARTTLEVS